MGDLEKSSGGTVPHIIGHPGGQLDDGIPGANNCFSEHMNKRLVVAKMTPLLKKIEMKDQNIYRGVESWGEYSADLRAAGSEPPSGQDHLLVCMSVLNSVSETYQNDYGDSELLPTSGGDMIGSKASELMRLTGARSTEDLEKILDSHKGKSGALNKLLGLGGTVAGGYNGIVNGLSKALVQAGSENNNSMLANMGNTIHGLATQPWAKIGWPQMWKNCHFQSSYDLVTRLYCYNTVSDTEYHDQIYAPLAALKLFVTPRSIDGSLYTDPWMCRFEIPGMIHMPIAYVESMTVTLGGDEKDFSETGRPNVVDITMKINNVFGVCVNSRKETDQRPSVKRDMMWGIGSARNYKDPPKWKSSGGGGTPSQTTPPDNPTPTQQSTTVGRQTPSGAQKSSAPKLD